MSLLFWEEKYSVQVNEIDEQHKKMFVMINDLQRAMLGGQGIEMLQRTFAAMADYAATHFGTEEKYFQEYAYPDAQPHDEEHRQFESRLRDFRRQLGEAPDLAFYTRLLTTEVMKFLREWWLNHILVTDKKYSLFFNKRGLV